MAFVIVDLILFHLDSTVPPIALITLLIVLLILFHTDDTLENTELSTELTILKIPLKAPVTTFKIPLSILPKKFATVFSIEAIMFHADVNIDVITFKIDVKIVETPWNTLPKSPSNIPTIISKIPDMMFIILERIVLTTLTIALNTEVTILITPCNTVDTVDRSILRNGTTMFTIVSPIAERMEIKFWKASVWVTLFLTSSNLLIKFLKDSTTMLTAFLIVSKILENAPFNVSHIAVPSVLIVSQIVSIFPLTSPQ